MNKQYNNQRAVDVGTFISKALFKTLKNNFKYAFPGTASSFIMNKQLIEKVLQASDQMTGIRFMFGLEDPLNPNSVRLMLVPCASDENNDINSMALVSNQGYFDHLGQRYSLFQTVEMISNFVHNLVKRDRHLTYKTTTRGSFFGLNSLAELIHHEECQYVLFHFGLNDRIIHPILEPLNHSLESFAKVYLERAQPCPPYCPDGDGSGCFAKITTKELGQEEDLKLIRHFRDEVLLKLENGAKYYEMYYFISPFISSIIRKEENGNTILSDIYKAIINPMKVLIEEERYDEAYLLLKTELSNLIRDYEIDIATEQIYAL